MISLELHSIEGIELVGSRRLLQYFVDGGFEIRVVCLEEIFEQKREELTCPDE